MSGELAQCVAVATHVSMWLADPSGTGELSGVPEFADLVAFDSVVGTEHWAERLAGDGVDRLWLHIADLGTVGLTPPVSASFVGGVPVALLSTGPAGTLLWQGQWSAGTRVADGAQILMANYLSGPAEGSPARVGTDAARQELDRALRRAERFAAGQALPTWARVFAEARRQREGSGQGAPGRNLFPASWPDPEGPRLTDMALASWVFGGMGSWNDVGFADGGVQREYEQLSGELFDAVMRACVAAVNIDLEPTRSVSG